MEKPLRGGDTVLPPFQRRNQSPSCIQLTLPSLSSAEEGGNERLRGGRVNRGVCIQLTETTGVL